MKGIVWSYIMSNEPFLSLFLEVDDWLEDEEQCDAICEGDVAVDKNGMSWTVPRRKRKEGLVWDYILESECEMTRRKMWGKWVSNRHQYGIEITDQKSLESYRTWYLIKFGEELKL
jgi:hypothetical protein